MQLKNQIQLKIVLLHFLDHYEKFRNCYIRENSSLSTVCKQPYDRQYVSSFVLQDKALNIAITMKHSMFDNH